ncbi:MAG: AAA family ATPase [Aquificota bacterium]|nr:AAA family ATPase [Aquificota bacterium]
MRKVVVVFGLSGSGKSFLSKLISEEFGYEWVRSDVIRKEIAGIPSHRSARSGFGEGIYTEEMTRKVYTEMVERASRLIKEGKRVVLDATFLKRWQREMVASRFDRPLFILTWAEEEEIKRRLSKRVDVSDADFEIYLRQKEVFEPPEEISYVRINTQKSKEDLKDLLSDLLKYDP